MSYKSNPWDYEKDIHGVSDKGIFRGKSSIFYLFSGVLGWLVWAIWFVTVLCFSGMEGLVWF